MWFDRFDVVYVPPAQYERINRVWVRKNHPISRKRHFPWPPVTFYRDAYERKCSHQEYLASLSCRRQLKWNFDGKFKNHNFPRVHGRAVRKNRSSPARPYVFTRVINPHRSCTRGRTYEYGVRTAATTAKTAAVRSDVLWCFTTDEFERSEAIFFFFGEKKKHVWDGNDWISVENPESVSRWRAYAFKTNSRSNMCLQWRTILLLTDEYELITRQAAVLSK